MGKSVGDQDVRAQSPLSLPASVQTAAPGLHRPAACSRGWRCVTAPVQTEAFLPGNATCAASNLAGDLMATTSHSAAGPCVKVWELTVPQHGWKLRSSVPVPERATHLSWAHPDNGPLVAAATASGSVYIIEPPRPRLFDTGGATSDTVDQGDAMAVVPVEEGPQAGLEVPLSEKPWRVTRTLKTGVNAPVSHLCFAPRQLGLLVCVTCRDGLVLMWEGDRPYAPNTWCLQAKFKAGTGAVRSASGAASTSRGCVGVSWRQHSPGLAPLMAVGLQHTVEIWQYISSLMRWQRVSTLELSSTDQPCTSLHWAPTWGRPADTLAAAHGPCVDIFTLKGPTTNMETEIVDTLRHRATVNKIEFNKSATVLSVSTVSNEVHLWLTNMVGQWHRQVVYRGTRVEEMPGSDGDSDDDDSMGEGEEGSDME